METWYRTGGFGKNLIEPVAVVKSTEKSVVVREKDWSGRERDRRVSITTGWHHFFKTWDEAHTYVVASAEAKVTNARRLLNDANGHLSNARGLKKPAQPHPSTEPAESGKESQ